MGNNHSNAKKSYYSVEYINNNNNIDNNNNSNNNNYINNGKNNNYNNEKLPSQTKAESLIYETLNYSPKNRYECLNQDLMSKNKKRTYVVRKSIKKSNSDLKKIFDPNSKYENVANVKRSKSYVKPENKVLPLEFPTKPLRNTNLLKTDGFKRTWRNKPSLKKTKSIHVTNYKNESDQQDVLIKPSLIKSLINQSTPILNEYNKDATSNDFTDFDTEFEIELENAYMSKSSYNLNNKALMENMSKSMENFNKNKIETNNYNKNNNEKHSLLNSNINKKSITINERDSIKKPLKSKSFLSQIKSYKTIKTNKKAVHEIRNEEKENKKNSTKRIKSFNKSSLSNNDKDIQIISRFPINSKVYRHYISGNSSFNIDKLTNCVQQSNMINMIINEKNNEKYSKQQKYQQNNQQDSDFEQTYDSIKDYKSKKMSSCLSTTSDSTASSLPSGSSSGESSCSNRSSSPYSTSSSSQSTKGEYFINEPKKEPISNNNNNNNNNNKFKTKLLSTELNFTSSPASSSIFSALTSSSVINSSNSSNNNNPIREYRIQKLNPNKKNTKQFLSSCNLSSASNTNFDNIKNSSFENDYNNNFNNLKKQNKISNSSSSCISQSLDHLNKNIEYTYEMLSNANSGIDLKSSKFSINSDNKSKKKLVITEESRRLNEIFQDEIQRAYKERSKRFEQVKQILHSNPNFMLDLNSIKNLKSESVNDINHRQISRPSINNNNNTNNFVQTKISSFENNVFVPAKQTFKNETKNNLKQSKTSAFTKIEPKINKSLGQQKHNEQNEFLFKSDLDTIKDDIPSFYLRPPLNYDDNHDVYLKNKKNDSIESFDYSLNDELDSCEQEVQIRVPIEQNNFKYIDIIDSKSNKYKFIPENENTIKEFFPPNFQAPPPPPEFLSQTESLKANEKEFTFKQENNYEEFGISSSIDNDNSVETPDFNKNKNSNFILKTKKTDYNHNKFDVKKTENEKIPAVILIDSNESSNSESKSNDVKATKSFSKGRRKGLEEIFPGIKISGSSSISNNSTITTTTTTTTNSNNNNNRSKVNNYKEDINTQQTLKIENKNSFSRIDDPEWIPASDLYDFDLDDSDYESSYQLSSFNDTNKVYDGKNNFLKGGIMQLKKDNKNLVNNFKLPMMPIKNTDPKPLAKEKIDYSEILNSIENFFY